ncbi:MarR family winged helix-turn-helix transcriptional regulator [Novosphingobium resinovorum]|uniref:MarR family winged helix-turn-helix transcriptional regulator n=1 Tax=Novosphingobium TaxID=165696 RepID=UPI001B3C7EB9|nr:MULTISPECIES: MarR family winged helix-turn-helix transcriptional regulator [Novosphingobium]MBF7013662.1 winged helix-turn-helix transcriptional regulator [Novosphingobium sp. HR1a]WJM25811.1 MarR family winged helix-turn-helix transcriptional regulator [Novosphingobium resinovorum]
MKYTKAGDPTQAGFKLASAPFYLMAHADYKYHEDMEIVLLKHGVDRSIYRIMTVLREAGTLSISRIAELALLKRPTVSRAIERMSERGLVETRPCPDDNRITEVTMTEAGLEVMGTLTPIVARQVARGLEGIPDKDIGVLIRTLQRVVENLNRLAIE